MTTNSKIIQRTTPTTHPAMIPTDEPSSSLLLCAPVAAVIVLDIDTIMLLGDTNVAVAVIVSLLDVTEVVGVAVAVSLVDAIEMVGVAIAASLVDATEIVGVAVVASLVVTKVVRLTKGQTNVSIYKQKTNL